MAAQGFFSEHWNDADDNPAGGVSSGRGFAVSWQNGPLGKKVWDINADGGRGAVKEERREPNGAFVEDVIAAAMDRVNYYQQSKFNCPENAEAIGHLQLALNALNSRTARREASGIEGTHAEDSQGEVSKSG